MVLDSTRHFVNEITNWVNTDVHFGSDEKESIAVCRVVLRLKSSL